MALVLVDSQTTQNDFWSIANVAARQYLSTSFVAGSTYTLKAIDLFIRRLNSPTQNLYVYLYSDNGSDYPDTLLATATNTINAATLTTSFAWYQFLFSGISINTGATYHIVVYADAVDDPNRPQFGSNLSVSGESIRISGDATTWSNLDTDAQLDFRTYYDDSGVSGSPWYYYAQQ